MLSGGMQREPSPELVEAVQQASAGHHLLLLKTCVTQITSLFSLLMSKKIPKYSFSD